MELNSLATGALLRSLTWCSPNLFVLSLIVCKLCCLYFLYHKSNHPKQYHYSILPPIGGINRKISYCTLRTQLLDYSNRIEMDAQLNETFDMIGYASALGEKGYAQLKKDLNAKTDVWTDLALAPNNQYGTVLLSFISQVNLNPLNALASIILLSYQAMNMTPNIAVHELFIRQVRILVSHVDDSVKKDYEKFKGMFVAGNDSFALICSKIADGFGTNELQRQQTASPEVYERVSAMMLFVMEKASEVSSPRPNCLTVAHCHFMQLCAQQRRYVNM